MKKLQLFTLILVSNELEPRNLRRLNDISIPQIIVSSSNNTYTHDWQLLNIDQLDHEYCLQHSYLRHRALKNGFDKPFFDKHQIPDSIIEFRNKTGTVLGSMLQHLMEELLIEIKQGYTKYTHFSVLKDTDFNYKALSGLLVLKFNNYPFVVKISIEHPHTIVQPTSKSIQAYGIFVVGGNLRHLTNFTRIPNLERIKAILSYHPFYLRYLDFPRKWYWQPKQSHDLVITWRCNNQYDNVVIPGVYAVVSDFIDAEPNQPQSDLNKLSMKVAADTGFLIDPHSGNIVIEKGTRNYVLLDTENFRMMVGLSKSMKAKKYTGWLYELVFKSLKTMFFRTKQERLEQTMAE
ncbi:hypothetical protein KAZ82_01035 [Candidatus Babeliales bacterium]|nr:hypothetical protein [Candidatus Babeliales bacterium]